MSLFWLAAWALATSLAWLLPNHYLPWTAFHMDAWMAIACLLAGGAVLVRCRAALEWRGLHTVALILLAVPVAQWAFGQIRFAGVAWMHSLYVLGLLLALLIGGRWEADSPGQPADAIFLAIGMAAFASVGLQLYQWLELDGLELWVMPDKFNRPFANFGQPNQMATLHLWGLLALAWGYCRGQLRGNFAALGAVFLLYGLAMTASRASWIGLGWIVLAAWVWRPLWPDRRAPWAVVGLAAVFALFMPSVSYLRELILGGDPATVQELTRIVVVGENRPAIWSMMLDGLRQSPWLGYGWGQVQWAHLAVAADNSPKFNTFAHAHNLALDLLLWMGIPLALPILWYLGYWLWSQLRRADHASRALPALLVLVTVNHALFELPLHYGYFLWPVGLLAGAIDTHSARPPWAVIPRWIVAMVWAMCAAFLALVIRDYSRVEPEYQKLRFEWAHIKTDPALPPEVIVLDQFPAFVEAIRLEPSVGMGEPQIRALRDVASQFPSPAMLQKLARAQALNGLPQDAARTMETMCSVVPPAMCKAIRVTWLDEGRREPAIQAVRWPRD